jgi:hypothetical protein
MKNTNEQLELTIQPKTCPSTMRRQRRVSTARLWFARMRQIVDSAPDWPARPLQPPLIPARSITLSSPATDQQHLAE